MTTSGLKSMPLGMNGRKGREEIVLHVGIFRFLFLSYRTRLIVCHVV
jgi:hypothetical protein